MGSLLALLAAMAFQGDGSTRARDLVEKLDADRIEDREKAEKDLDFLGAAAIPELKRLRASAQGEFAGRIERVLRKLILREPWEEKLLSTLNERGSWHSVVFSDGGHVAHPVTTNQRSRVVLDGTPGEEFDDVRSLTFGPDGKTLAYVGDEEKKHEVKEKQWVIAGPRKLGPYFEVGSHWRVPFVFSPDGARLAFRAASDEDTKFIVLDGRAQEAFDDVDHPVFSPDGSHLAYAANRGGKHQESIYVVSGGEWFVVLDGKKGETFDWVGHTCGEGGWPTFSPDGSRLAYKAQRGKKWFMVVDGKREEGFDLLFGPAFTPDSRHVEYSAENGKDWLLIRDGKRVTDNHPAIIAQAVSPDGAHYAYACVDQSKRWSVFVDGAPVGSFDFAYAPTFSKDGKRVAYLAHEGDDQFIIVDGHRGASFEHVGAPIFDADGKDPIYVAGSGKKRFVVWGATRGEEFDAIVTSDWNAICPLLRSPKSSMVAYRARVGGEYDSQNQEYVGAQWFVVVGDRKLGPFDQVWDPKFSPDGKKVAFGALKGRDLWWRVVDVP
jgi:Tol biopolymer transport system component